MRIAAAALTLLTGAALVGAALLGGGAPPAAAKGAIGSSPAPAGVALPGSPYRYVTIAPGRPDRLTVVERIVRRGGRVSGWWYLPGGFYVTSPTYDGAGVGLSADESTLVLSRPKLSLPAARTELAILRPGVHPAHPGNHRRRLVSYVSLKGDYGIYAVSPDGRTVFLSHVVEGPPGELRFTIAALDTASGKLLPRQAIAGNGETLAGAPIARASDHRGRRVYTLYREESGRAYVLGLDTAAPRLARFELPRERLRKSPYLLALSLDAAGRELTVSPAATNHGSERPLVRLDVRDFASPPPPSPHRGPRPDFLALTGRAGRGDAVRAYRDVVGESARGRPIEALALGAPGIRGRLLVFGCIHGDECAARGIEPLSNGCPDPRSNIVVVPDLDPDGAALGTRLNGRGVDLNRNFPAGWLPIGSRGELEYAGPRPFSEPESRLAAWLVRGLRPRATVWFHQFRGSRPFVRAWGQSVPPARRFAASAGISFRLMPWQAGTAPNWQNHAFRGTSSFVVELPDGALPAGLERRLERALLDLGREVGQA